MKKVLILLPLIILGLLASAQICNYPAVDSNANMAFTCKGLLQLNGKIDDSSTLTLTSLDGNVVVTGKIVKNSKVTINAQRGSVTLQQKIDSGAVVKIICRGDITIQGKIDGAANCDFYTERGKITVADKVANAATVIRYHSIQPPSWGSSIAIKPKDY